MTEKVTAPDGRRYLLTVHPRGVPDTAPVGGAALEWLVGWLIHLIRFRKEWVVRVKLLGGLSIRPDEVIEVGGFVDRATADERLRQTAVAIAQGWSPTGVGEPS